MEFKEVIGRHIDSLFCPVSSRGAEKIQTILEAARLASCAVNATFLRAIVVLRDDLASSARGLKTPVSALNLELAPVHLYFYGDLRTLQVARQDAQELIEVGALNPSHGWSHAFVDEVVWKQVIEPLSRDPLKLVGAVAVDCGVAICQALLAAFDEGLGACLSAFEHSERKRPLGCRHTGCHSLRYAGGLSGRILGSRWSTSPTARRVMLKDAMNPWRDPHVVVRLTAARMLQDPAPLPWRQAEIKTLARAFGLPE